MLIGLAGNSFGLLVGVIFTDFKVSSIIAPVVFYPMMLFSGFYVSSGIFCCFKRKTLCLRGLVGWNISQCLGMDLSF
jgi:xanthosine utilization system XapX-like protein